MNKEQIAHDLAVVFAKHDLDLSENSKPENEREIDLLKQSQLLVSYENAFKNIMEMLSKE